VKVLSSKARRRHPAAFRVHDSAPCHLGTDGESLEARPSRLRSEISRPHAEATEGDHEVASVVGVTVRLIVADQAPAPLADGALRVEYHGLEWDAEDKLLGQSDQTIEGFAVVEGSLEPTPALERAEGSAR
jgi:hypothetical protein